MLTPVKRVRAERAADRPLAIIASRYNRRYVDGMLRAASACLREAGVKSLTIVRVPGAFEIPVVAGKLASRTGNQQLAAVICLGVILRGETTHAQFIGEAVTSALMQIQIQHQIPIIHEVLLLETPAQAEVRCLGKEHNRGREAAQTALQMAELMARLAR